MGHLTSGQVDLSAVIFTITSKMLTILSGQSRLLSPTLSHALFYSTCVYAYHHQWPFVSLKDSQLYVIPNIISLPLEVLIIGLIFFGPSDIIDLCVGLTKPHH